MVNNSTFAKILFTFALVLGFNSAFAAWDGTTKEKPSEKDNAYIIDTEAKLAWFSDFVNQNKGNSAGANAVLAADLDMGGHLWIPLCVGTGGVKDGKNYCKYHGTFDGNGHVIKNLYINGIELAAFDKNYMQNLGFVGVLGGGKIRNLMLENVDIHASTNAGDVLSNTEQQISVGSFVGWMSETSGSVVEKCMVTGSIRTTGNGQGVGGIVGNAKIGTISDCLSLVEIMTSGSKAYVGGIIGITKSDVSVKSCVYAGPGLVNIGTDGAVGGIAGNVFSGTLTTDNDYYEGNASSGVGAQCLGNTNPDGSCKASSISVTGKPVKVDISNQDSVACHLNGLNEDKTCKTEPWSVGETALSLSGYGTDGYMIVFYANGGKYADGSESRNKFFDAGMAINADDIVPPSHEEKTFIGWSLDRNATEPAENLGTVSESDTVFAVWQPKLTVTFDVFPGVFPDENVYMKTKRVDKGGLVTVGGLGTLPTSYSERSPDSVSYGSETLFYFTGWARNSNATESDTIHLDGYTTDEDLTLYAVWTTEETYTVTYNANGHGKTRVDYVRVKNNNKIERPQDPIAHDGYEFVDWFTEASCENSFNFAKSSITESITLYAKWEPENYTITYVIGDGVANATENPSEYNIETETINLKAPTPAEGMVFDGWFNDAAFSKKVTRIAKGSFGDKTFYAKWSTKTYRISYLADNNSYGSVSDQIKEHGSSITLLSSANFTRNKDTDTYEVIGWAETPNGEKKYELGQTYETDASLILYPAWSHKRYTITYELNGGELPEGESNPETYTIETENITLVNPTKTGYKFEGWYDSEENQVTTIKKGSTGNLNLTAFWNTVKYSIEYDANGATLPDTVKNPQPYTIEDVITLPVLSRKGYEFKGWFDSNDNQVTEIPAGSFGDIVLTAKWNAVVYTVTYVTKNGANSKPNVNSYTVEDVAGDKVIELKPATRCGFDFGGWYKDENFSGDAVTQIKNGDAENLTLYPKWIEITAPVKDYDAVKIYEDKDGLTCALMEGRSFGAVALNEDIEVSYVTLDREFNSNTTKEENKLSTIVLPFTIERNKVDGASFYKIVKVISEGSERGVYISRVKDVEIRANTPYIIRPTKENLTFNIDKENNETVTLNTSVINNTKSENEEWELRGVYSYKKWLEGDEELGYAYGYTAKSTNKLAAGKFDVNEAGAYIFPFRAYLLNIPNPVTTPTAQAVAPSPFLAKSAPTSSVSVENLIQSGSLEVFVVDGLAGENGGTTSIASERIVPARAKTVNGWYDMKGRRLNGKPTAKGIYYYNNKRIRIQ